MPRASVGSQLKKRQVDGHGRSKKDTEDPKDLSNGDGYIVIYIAGFNSWLVVLTIIIIVVIIPIIVVL